MGQTSSDIKAARDAAGKYGRINWSEYSRLTGTPMPKGTAPKTNVSPQQDKRARKKIANARRIAGMGRLTNSEYKALMAKRGKKATPRKRSIAK